MISGSVKPEFWTDKSVLITGHTGFKGFWLSLYLKKLGANVCGISLPPCTSPNLFDLSDYDEIGESIFCDIRDQQQLLRHCRSANPEFIFHLAAQPLVRESYKDPISTFSSNIMGTVNILECMRGLSDLKAAVMITTDKVYEDNFSKKPYKENDPLGGHDPYSASKAACEIVIDSYRKAFLSEKNISLASARSGNVIGGGDWSSDRLIPDAIKAWTNNEILEIRNPNATRPWQHVLEPLHGYIVLAQEIIADPKKSLAYNFGPEPDSTASVQEVINLAKSYFGPGDISFDGDGLNDGPHEAEWLSLDLTKSKRELNFVPRWNLSETVEHTISWYKNFYNDADPLELCNEQIDLYESLK